MPAFRSTGITILPAASVLNVCSVTRLAGFQVSGSEASGFDSLVMAPPDEGTPRPIPTGTYDETLDESSPRITLSGCLRVWIRIVPEAGSPSPSSDWV